MVSADNVNYDVLTLIFAFLGNTDLVSTSLVSKSFKNGATPRLYRSICFHLNHMKKWPEVTSPFSTIVAHPRLGVHVRHCDITAVPKKKGQPHPDFMSSCAKSLALCTNLFSFNCTSDVLPFLTLLPTKQRLRELRLNAVLNTPQAKVLLRVSELRSLALYQASWNVCNTLPAWTGTLAETLTHLTINNSREFNEVVLEQVLIGLPALHGLHIVGCSKIAHHTLLRLVEHTPLLESLSFTTWENPSVAATPLSVSLPHLHALSVDTRCSFSPHSVPPLYASLFTALAACPLTSLTFRLSERMVVGDTFITQILDDHAATLKRLNAVNVSLTESSLDQVFLRCVTLEQLTVVVPVESMYAFSDSLLNAPTLRTLIDVGAHSGSSHGVHATLTASHVRQIFELGTGLRTVISGNRRWTCERIPLYSTEDEYDSENDEEEEREPQDYEIKLKLDRVRRSGGGAGVGLTAGLGDTVLEC